MQRLLARYKKYFISDYSGWRVDPKFDIKNIDDEEKKNLIISHSKRLFDVIQNGTKVVMVGSSKESLETFVQAIELGVKGCFVWTNYNDNLPDLTQFPEWLQEPIYYRGPFQMNVEILQCAKYTLNNEYEQYLWDDCKLTTWINESKRQREGHSNNKFIKVVPASDIQANSREFKRVDGWFICAPSSQDYEMNAVQHWRSVLESVASTYEIHLYNYYSLRVPARFSVILVNIYTIICLVPWFICLYYQYDAAQLIIGLGIFYPFHYHFFKVVWLTYSPKGVSFVNKHGNKYRQFFSIFFTLSYMTYTMIPIYINSIEYRISPITGAPLAQIFIVCVIIAAIYDNGYLSRQKMKWGGMITALPILYFLFPPFIVISIFIEQISPLLSGLYIGFVFILLEYGTIFVFQLLYLKIVYEPNVSYLNEAKNGTPLKVTHVMTGDQKSVLVFIFTSIRTLCETARLCTLCSTLILSSWKNNKFTGEENHSTYISASIFSLIMSTFARAGYSEFIIQIFLKKIFPQRYLVWKMYIVPSFWTWVHRDCCFLFGYFRFAVIGSVFIARGCVLETGFQFYTGSLHSFCWTPAILYNFILNFILEIIEDIIVYKQSNKTRDTVLSNNEELAVNHKEDSYHPDVTVLTQNKVEWGPQFKCVLKKYSLMELFTQVLSNIQLINILFILFFGKESYLGEGIVKSPFEYIVDNLIDLLIWKIK